MSNEKFKSVLVFYSINDDTIFDMSIKSIWDNFVMTKVEGVTCRHVLHFEASPEELLSMVNRKNLNPKLISDIKSEYDFGANVMFVNPVIGNPLDGFFIKDFIHH